MCLKFRLRSNPISIRESIFHQLLWLSLIQTTSSKSLFERNVAPRFACQVYRLVLNSWCPTNDRHNFCDALYLVTESPPAVYCRGWTACFLCSCWVITQFNQVKYSRVLFLTLSYISKDWMVPLLMNASLFDVFTNIFPPVPSITEFFINSRFICRFLHRGKLWP